MNAIELLKKDHRTVKSLFESFEKAKKTDEETSKAELFASIKEELDAHARVEEEIFYPAFDRTSEDADDKELVLEAGEEHKQVKTLLAELEGMDPDDQTFDAKMKVLKDNVEHHVKEEEGEMFPHAQKQLGSDELEALGQRIAARKEQIQQEAGRPAARSADARPAAKASPSSRARTTSPGRRSGREKDTATGGASSRSSSSRASRSSGGRTARKAGARPAGGRASSRGASSGARGRSASTRGRSSSSRVGRSRGRGRSARA